MYTKIIYSIICNYSTNLKKQNKQNSFNTHKKNLPPTPSNPLVLRWFTGWDFCSTRPADVKIFLRGISRGDVDRIHRPSVQISSEAKVGGWTTHLKNMSQIGNLPQIQQGWKLKEIMKPPPRYPFVNEHRNGVSTIFNRKYIFTGSIFHC